MIFSCATTDTYCLFWAAYWGAVISGGAFYIMVRKIDKEARENE